ncbi:hypothetical protein VHEMI03261 [[Torrubiella] hemipterigena]|uniref:ATP-grasp domain-containing protein n=1 Tax=[Torrubiella] hemipterigena TaxID=1531966 RepID=A0A0A1TAD0_9HYPO|nr:hypothetical protein VHEMI03261 [[Torrubiella] hemipterigena]
MARPSISRLQLLASQAARCHSFSTTARCAQLSAADAAARLLETSADTVSVRKQLIDGNQLQKLALTLNRPTIQDVDITQLPPPEGTPVPPGYHLVYFTPNGLESELGPDGTDKTFNAPAPFSRRMWAGGKMSWQKEIGGPGLLRVGDVAEERTRLKSAIPKKSKSGAEMVLVEVEKEVWGPRGLAMIDQRSWIFRPEVDASAGEKNTEKKMRGPTSIADIQGPEFKERQFRWSPVALFRFSALTFNGHKIHYNEDWTASVEGHPGLVVHGPLNLINILDYWRDMHGAGKFPRSVEYRAMSPLYAGDEYLIKTKSINQENKTKAFEVVAEKGDTTYNTTDENSAADVLYYSNRTIGRQKTNMSCRRPVAQLLSSRLAAPFSRQVRALSLHQYQSQRLLQEAGVSVPRGRVASTPEEVRAAVQELGNESIVNAQVLQLRRQGRQGLAKDLRGENVAAQSPQAAEALAASILNNSDAPDGVNIQHIYVAESAKYNELWYLGMTVDRENYCPAIILSKKGGGKNIKTIAQESPESLMTFPFGLTAGITDELMSNITQKAGLSAAQTKNLRGVLTAMHSIFKAKDAMLLEIPSLGVTSSGAMTAIDSNFTFDDDGAKRQKDLFALRDKDQEVSDEVAAEKFGLVYIRMDGNIGNVVNGAGLAMATNDAVSNAGGKSANFLDAGGQATKETMMEAFGIILRDERVKAILVNIYGGITRCDMIAESIIGAADSMDIHVPVVVRLQGTNSAAGLRLVEEANLGLYVEEDFGKAAARAVQLANGGK